MQITFTPKAVKDMKAMPAADRAAIIGKLETFAATGRGDLTKLVGSEHLYRLRHGIWRAIFEMRDDVIVLRVLHRREAYR